MDKIQHWRHTVRRRMMGEAIVAAAVFVLLSALFIYFDMFDRWWHFTRSHEDWELDELLLVILAFLFVVAGMALRQAFTIATLLKKQEEYFNHVQQFQVTQSQKSKLEALGVMSSGVSHEIKNALQPIIGLGEILEDRAKAREDEESLKYIRTIVESAHYAADISQKVLAFSKQDKPVVIEVADIVPILSRALDFITGHISTDVVINRDYLQHNTLGIRVRLSVEAFIPVIMNLCINACEAMDNNGTIVVDIIPKMNMSKEKLMALDLDENIDYMGILITDTGHGMPLEEINRIFDPFYSTKSDWGNSGLGLSTVYGLVRDMKGAIDVRSTVGMGSSFCVILCLD